MAVWPMKRGPQGPAPASRNCPMVGVWRMAARRCACPAAGSVAGRTQEEEAYDADGDRTGAEQAE